MDEDFSLYKKALEIYGIDDQVDTKDIKNEGFHTSDWYALGPVFTFDYKGSHYYLVNDYSLGDDPKYVENILSDINHLLKGEIVKKPFGKEKDGLYVALIENEEYYLWKSPLLT